MSVAGTSEMQNKIMKSKNRRLRSGQFQFTSSASPQGVGLYPYTLGWFTLSTRAPSDWISQDDNNLVGSSEKNKKTVSMPRPPPTNTALSHSAALYTAAWSCSPSTIHIPTWPLTLQSSWQAEPLTAYPLNSFCLHEHWSMKHAIRQNWDAEILSVSRDQTKLSLNYITPTSLDCLKCTAGFLLQ